MSYKFLSPAWEAQLPAPQKLLLVSLADQANDEGQCWPSIASLMRRTGLQERTIYKHLAELEQMGHISRQSRDGRSTIYTVHPCTTCTPVIHDTPAPRAPHPCTTCTPTPAPRAPITVSRTVKEPTPPQSPPSPDGDLPVVAAVAEPGKPKPRAGKVPPGELPDGFEAFWQAYPRRVGKADAIKAWQKLAPDVELRARMLAAVTVQAKSRDWLKDGGAFIPHPATWLNGRRWEDEAPEQQPKTGRPTHFQGMRIEW